MGVIGNNINSNSLSLPVLVLMRLFSSLRMRMVGHLIMAHVTDASVTKPLFGMLEDKMGEAFKEKNLMRSKQFRRTDPALLTATLEQSYLE